MELPSPRALRELLSQTPEIKTFVESSRASAVNILQGKDPRFVLVVGPCSLHDEASSLEYAKRLKDLSEEFSSSFLLIMRAYVEKSRTSLGWKGILYDPKLDGSDPLSQGLFAARELLLKLSHVGIPLAAEFVDPLAALYFEDLLTWGFVGARTVSSQPHRQYVSSLPFPVGFKNALDGNIEPALEGIISAASPHQFLGINIEGKITCRQSLGNPFAHVVLRGSKEKSNFSPADIAFTLQKLSLLGLPARLMVDCAHGNSQKIAKKQEEVFYTVLEQRNAGQRQVFGMMLESHIYSGNQSLEGTTPRFGISITDPCLDWNSTEKLIRAAYDFIPKQSNAFSNIKI